MPPNENKKLQAKTPANLEKRAPGDIVARKPIAPPDRLIGFFSADAVDAAFKISDFDIAEEVSIAASLARSGDGTLSLSALKHLRAIAKDAAKASGLIGTVTQSETTRDEEGREVHRVASTQTLLQRLQKDREAHDKLDEDREFRSVRLSAARAGGGSDEVHDGPADLPDGSGAVDPVGIHRTGSPVGGTVPPGGPAASEALDPGEPVDGTREEDPPHAEDPFFSGPEP